MSERCKQSFIQRFLFTKYLCLPNSQITSYVPKPLRKRALITSEKTAAISSSLCEEVCVGGCVCVCVCGRDQEETLKPNV